MAVYVVTGHALGSYNTLGLSAAEADLLRQVETKGVGSTITLNLAGPPMPQRRAMASSSNEISASKPLPMRTRGFIKVQPPLRSEASSVYRGRVRNEKSFTPKTAGWLRARQARALSRGGLVLG
jgi:hypothetical protein